MSKPSQFYINGTSASPRVEQIFIRKTKWRTEVASGKNGEILDAIRFFILARLQLSRVSKWDAIQFFQAGSVRGGVHGVHSPNPSVKKKLKCAQFGSRGYIIFTSMFTPEGSVRLVNASMIFGVGLMISINRLCTRISNCSRASL